MGELTRLFFMASLSFTKSKSYFVDKIDVFVKI